MRKKTVEISARMKALTELVSPGSIVCDIGCDHGFVSIYLVQQGIADKVLAMDIRSGPLSQAQAHIAEWGLEDVIETRLSDGLQNMKPGEADCMICAGMGGPLMEKILREGREKARVMKELILQPQSEIARFRKFLRTEHYHIVKEDMVYEEGKYYPVIKVVPILGESEKKISLSTELQEVQDLFGPCLLEQKHPILKQHLVHSCSVMEELQINLNAQRGEKAQARLPEIKEKLEHIYRALEIISANKRT